MPAPTTTSRSPSASTSSSPASRAALRRHQPASDDAVIRTEDFTVDLAAGEAWRAGEEVRLTPLEWRLVRQLVRNPGRLLTQQWLLQQVWGPHYGSETSYLARAPRRPPAQAGAQPVPTPLLHHRAGHGLPLRAWR